MFLRRQNCFLEDEFTNSKSNKLVANRMIYDYKEDDQNRYRVVFQRSQTILDFRFADMVTVSSISLPRRRTWIVPTSGSAVQSQLSDISVTKKLNTE